MSEPDVATETVSLAPSVIGPEMVSGPFWSLIVLALAKVVGIPYVAPAEPPL